LRFIVCFLFHERITEQCIRINLKYEEYNSKEQYCAISRKDDIVTLGWGRGLQSIQKFPIDQNRLTNLHNDGYLEAFSSMISSSATTDLEGLILTAMYWIGEAQNEHDLDIAYLKYWTVLESIFSEEANVTKSLIQGITIVNIFTPYRFIEISDVEVVSKRIDILYDKRSKIIHQGMNHLTQPVVTHLDVSEICKYASWSILALLDFRSQNYITISQIKNEIERLSAILSKDKSLKQLGLTK
jgi:Apea-like HEPN